TSCLLRSCLVVSGGREMARAVRLLLLHHREALELGMAEVERLVAAGVRMRLAELLGLRPGLERLARLPERVRGIEHVILALGALQQVEHDEAGHLAQVRLASGPDLLEVMLAPRLHLEAIHSDEHWRLSWLGWLAGNSNRKCGTPEVREYPACRSRELSATGFTGPQIASSARRAR